MCLKTKSAALEDVMDVILEKLEMGGTVTFTPHGVSMLPMLRDGEDVVMLKKPSGRLQLFDVPLYRRDNGQFVLHRVIDFTKDGSYVLCGDNQFVKEKGIRDDQIIAVVTGFLRKGKAYSPASLRYRAYVNFWVYSRPVRHIFRAVKSRVLRRFPSLANKKKKNTDKAD